MKKWNGHLADDRLLEISLHVAELDGPEQAHLAACAACEARRARLALTLCEIADAGAAAADAAFPPERLARQHARILQRVEHEGRPARVIAFPAGQAHEVRPRAGQRAARWVAVAAAAGLAIGLLAGHLAHDLPARRTEPETRMVAAPQPITPVIHTAALVSDDELLLEVDYALDTRVVDALEPLHDLTPR